MKLLTYSLKSNPEAYLLGAYTEVSGKGYVIPQEAAGLSFASMNDLIAHSTAEQRSTLASVVSAAAEALPAEAIAYDDVIRRSPIPCPMQDVICLGINYAAHAVESARYKKEAFERNREWAVYFSKRVNECVPDGGLVPAHRDITERLDYEAELAVVIGRDALNVSADDAFDYIFGYSILNDISAREVQTQHKQWYFGKSLEGFTPMGPWIVTEDEFDRPPVLAIRSRINGELRQNSDTGHLMFTIAQIIEELSHGMMLKAGTIISTGTPAGVGMGFEPPKFLVHGDVIECEIEGIGTLTNTVD